MKSQNLSNQTKDNSAILIIAIILSLGFTCVLMTGMSYGAEALPSMKIAGMDATLVSASRGVSAQVVVNITDQYGNPVEGATVSGDWSGLVKSSVSGNTGANGNITFVSRNTNKRGVFTFTVSDVACSSNCYDATQNMMTEISISTAEPVNQEPVAQIYMVPNTVGLVPFSVSVDAFQSYDPDGSIVSYDWNFGDGTFADTMTASHSYSEVGTFTITLTVKDDQGAIDTDSREITVTDGALKTMYISDISLITDSNFKGNKTGVNAVVTVKCLENGCEISNATVSVQWDGLFSYDESAVTGGSPAAAYFYSEGTRKSGYVIFTVTDITAPGYIYNPLHNYGTDASIYVY